MTPPNSTIPQLKTIMIMKCMKSQIKNSKESLQTLSIKLKRTTINTQMDSKRIQISS
jgi:hypothetical protein